MPARALGPHTWRMRSACSSAGRPSGKRATPLQGAKQGSRESSVRRVQLGSNASAQHVGRARSSSQVAPPSSQKGKKAAQQGQSMHLMALWPQWLGGPRPAAAATALRAPSAPTTAKHSSRCPLARVSAAPASVASAAVTAAPKAMLLAGTRSASAACRTTGRQQRSAGERRNSQQAGRCTDPWHNCINGGRNSNNGGGGI